MPHWLAHDWTTWKPAPKIEGSIHAAYEWRRYDMRECRTCGRRQMRPV